MALKKKGKDTNKKKIKEGESLLGQLAQPGEQESSAGEAAEGADGEGLGPCGFQDLNQDLNRCLLFPPGMGCFPGSGLGAGHRLVSCGVKLGTA